jgi:hypothetical protein
MISRLPRLPGMHLQTPGGRNSLLPFLLLLVDLEQETECLLVEIGAEKLREMLFGAVEQSRLQVVLRELEDRLPALHRLQVRALGQVLMHADGALDFAPAPEQAPQREMQLDGLRVDLHHFDEGLDRLVRLLVQEKVEALEVRAGKSARLGYDLLDIDARGEPPQAEEQRKREQPPVLELHAGAFASESRIGRRKRLRRCARLRTALALQFGDLAPLAEHLAEDGKHAEHDAGHDTYQHHEYEWSVPLPAEVVVDADRVAVLDRKTEQNQEQRDAQ